MMCKLSAAAFQKGRMTVQKWKQGSTGTQRRDSDARMGMVTDKSHDALGGHVDRLGGAPVPGARCLVSESYWPAVAVGGVAVSLILAFEFSVFTDARMHSRSLQVCNPSPSLSLCFFEGKADAFLCWLLTSIRVAVALGPARARHHTGTPALLQ